MGLTPLTTQARLHARVFQAAQEEKPVKSVRANQFLTTFFAFSPLSLLFTSPESNSMTLPCVRALCEQIKPINPTAKDCRGASEQRQWLWRGEPGLQQMDVGRRDSRGLSHQHPPPPPALTNTEKPHSSLSFTHLGADECQQQILTALCSEDFGPNSLLTHSEAALKSLQTDWFSREVSDTIFQWLRHKIIIFFSIPGSNQFIITFNIQLLTEI